MLLCMITLVLFVVAFLGFLSLNTNCEALLITVLVLNVYLGMVVRYVPAHLCERTGVSQWKNYVLIIAFLYPAIVFGILFELKLVLWSYLSAAAILFTTLMAFLLSLQHFDVYLDSTIVPVRIFRGYTFPWDLLIE